MAPEAIQQVEETISRSKLPDVCIAKHLPFHSYCFENLPQVSSRPCLINGRTGEVYTYADVELTERGIASCLNKVGVNQGEVLMLLLHNCPEFVLAFPGASYRGAIATGANPFFAPAETSKQAKASKATIIITQGCYVEKVKEFAEENNVKLVCIDSVPGGCLHFSELNNSDENDLPHVEINPDEVVALPYSSGTTGFPKGVMLTHKGLVTSVAQQVDGENPNLYFHSGDVILCVLPLFHIYALNSIMLCGLRVGAAILIMQKFEIGKLLELIQKHKVTIAPMVPPIVLAIAKSKDTDKYDLSSARMMKSGAAPSGKKLEDAGQAKFPGAKLGQNQIRSAIIKKMIVSLKIRGLSQFQHLQSPPQPAMISPTAFFLIALLILVLFATAATAAAPAAAPSVAPFSSSSVEFSGKSVSKHEVTQRCDIVINGGCTDKQCCWHRCEKQIPYAKSMDVSYKVIKGAHLCYCHAIYGGKTGSCVP